MFRAARLVPQPRLLPSPIPIPPGPPCPLAGPGATDAKNQLVGSGRYHSRYLRRSWALSCCWLVLLLAGLAVLGPGLQFKMLAAAEGKIRHRDRGIVGWNHHQDDVLIGHCCAKPRHWSRFGCGAMATARCLLLVQSGQAPELSWGEKLIEAVGMGQIRPIRLELCRQVPDASSRPSPPTKGQNLTN